MREAMSEYRFWGVHNNGNRDLVGVCKANTIGEALSCWPSVVSQTLEDYPRIEIEKYPPDNKLSAMPHAYPDDAYPDRHPRGSYWATTIGWDILDRLPPGKLDNAERAYLCGLIGGALSKERGEK